MTKYTAVIWFDDMYDHPHRKKVTIDAKSKADAYKKLMKENGVFEVEVWD